MTDADKKPDPEVPAATEPAVLETPPTNIEPSTNTEAESSTAPAPEKTREATLEQARIFLKDTETQKATAAQKTEFLKSKGLSDSDIQDLLKEVTQDAPVRFSLPYCLPAYITLTFSSPPAPRPTTTPNHHHLRPPKRRPPPHRHLPRIPHHPLPPPTPNHPKHLPQHSLRLHGVVNPHLRHLQVCPRTHGHLPHRLED